MLTVRRVAVEEVVEYNAFVVILYEYVDGSGEHLEFQRALSFDEQDVNFGMDTYCIGVDGAVHYGGVIGWELGNGVLVLNFSAEAAVSLRIAPRFEIELDLDGASLSSLERGLTHILGIPPHRTATICVD